MAVFHEKRSKKVKLEQEKDKEQEEAAQEEESSCLVNWFGLLTISLLAPKSATGANFRSDIVYL